MVVVFLIFVLNICFDEYNYHDSPAAGVSHNKKCLQGIVVDVFVILY